MGVYIKDMEIPKTHVLFCIHPDGKVFAHLEGGWREYKAVPIPPHGDLIDRDGIKWIEEEFEERCHNDRWTVVETIAYKAQVDKLPTIIPAEGGEADGKPI